MVSIAVAGLLMFAASALMIYMFKQHSQTYQGSYMHSQLFPTINAMKERIGRAGYWSAAHTGAPYNYPSPGGANPFTASGWDLSVGNGGTCLVFSYDQNRDGLATANEQVGYRLTGGIVEEGIGATDCAHGTWAALTESRVINITKLQFVITAVNLGSFIKRSVDIQIMGEPVLGDGDPLHLNYVVRVSNDKAI